MKRTVIALICITLVGCSLFFPPPKKVAKQEEQSRVINQIESLHLENERKKIAMQRIESVKAAQKPQVIAIRKPVKFNRVEQSRNRIETIELNELTVKPRTRILRIKDGEKVIEEKIIK